MYNGHFELDELVPTVELFPTIHVQNHEDPSDAHSIARRESESRQCCSRHLWDSGGYPDKQWSSQSSSIVCTLLPIESLVPLYSHCIRGSTS